MENYFAKLNAVNVNEHTEKKNGLTYLSWPWAWAEVKKAFADSTYTVYENAQGWNYHTDGKTCWVKTGVTVNGIEHIEYLPVMDVRNKSIPANQVTSVDVNKAIQRSLTKACARHGLGLYIYAGEDLPEDKDSADDKASPHSGKPQPGLQQEGLTPNDAICPVCGGVQHPIKKVVDGKTKVVSGQEIVAGCGGKCWSCYQKERASHDAV